MFQMFHWMKARKSFFKCRQHPRMQEALQPSQLRPLPPRGTRHQRSHWRPSRCDPSAWRAPNTWHKWIWLDLFLPYCCEFEGGMTWPPPCLHRWVGNRQLLGHCLQCLATCLWLQIPRPRMSRMSGVTTAWLTSEQTAPHLRSECRPFVSWPNGDSDCVAACRLSQGQRCHWCHLAWSYWGGLGWCGDHDPQKLCCSSSWIRTRRNQFHLEQRWAVACSPYSNPQFQFLPSTGNPLRWVQELAEPFLQTCPPAIVPWSRIGARNSGCRFASRPASSWPPHVPPLRSLSRDRESAIGRSFLGSGACNELHPKWWCADRLSPPHLSCHQNPVFALLLEIVIRYYIINSFFPGEPIAKHDFILSYLWKRRINFLQGKKKKRKGTIWLISYSYYLTSSLAFYLTSDPAFYLTYSTFWHFIWHS